MTTTTRAAPTSHAATGVFSLAWLLVALPLLGAAVLLLGGRRTDRWGHLLGTAMPARLVRARRPAFFAACSAATPTDRARRPAPLHLDRRSARFHVDVGLLLDQLSIVLRAADHRRRHADPHLLDRLHGARPGPAPVLRLPQPVRRGDAAARPGRQLPAALRRLGGRRSRVVPADRVLEHKPAAATAAKKAFVVNRVGDFGLSRRDHDHVRRVRHASTSPGVFARPPAARARRRSPRSACCCCSRACGKSAQFPLQSWLARRDGGPDAGLGADPRGDDGHRRRLPDRPVGADLRRSRRRAQPSWSSSARSR